MDSRLKHLLAAACTLATILAVAPLQMACGGCFNDGYVDDIRVQGPECLYVGAGPSDACDSHTGVVVQNNCAEDFVLAPSGVGTRGAAILSVRSGARVIVNEESYLKDGWYVVDGSLGPNRVTVRWTTK